VDELRKRFIGKPGLAFPSIIMRDDLMSPLSQSANALSDQSLFNAVAASRQAVRLSLPRQGSRVWRLCLSAKFCCVEDE
jgi:hypothetical protein